MSAIPMQLIELSLDESKCMVFLCRIYPRFFSFSRVSKLSQSLKIVGWGDANLETIYVCLFLSKYMKFSLFNIAQSTQYLWHQQALCLCADDLGHPDWILTFSGSFELNLFHVAAQGGKKQVSMVFFLV